MAIARRLHSREEAEGWLQDLENHHPPIRGARVDLAAARLTCSSWAKAVARTTTRLQPRGEYVPGWQRLFPELRWLHLEGMTWATLGYAPHQDSPRSSPSEELRKLPSSVERVSLEGSAGHVEDAARALAPLAPSLTRLDLWHCDGTNARALLPLASLTSLTHLSLAHSGPIRDDDLAGILPLAGTLRSLDLTSTGQAAMPLLTRKGLMELRHLSALETLALGLSQFPDEALVGIGLMPSLTDLDVRSSVITGHFLQEPLFVSAPRLRSLTLDGCKNLTDTGVASLAAMTSLTRLSMRRCAGPTASAVSEALAPLKATLAHLDLAAVHFLEEELLRGLATHEALTHLDLEPSRIILRLGHVDFPAWDLGDLRHLTALTSLNVIGVKIRNNKGSSGLEDQQQQQQHRGEEEPEHCELGALKAVRSLSATLPRDSLLEQLRPLAPSLTDLTLTGWHVHWYHNRDITEEGMAAALGALTSLTRLGLPVCPPLSTTALRAIAALPRLRDLDVSDCGNLTDAAAAELPRLAETLTDLSLDGCASVTDRGAASLGALTGLRALNLGNCPEVTDAGVASLQALTGLERLSLRGCCRITDAGMQLLLPMVRLRELVVEGCTSATRECRRKVVKELPRMSRYSC